ncbi:Holliday junction resolvase RuvX [Saccharospirillum mangrovi]|uniref:Holliday junction resolvase RuvX n=1 Tax=Saccharospirillum mangrovi TaxID=2161747 RepID=UPI000D37045B|nr:Holliday junction resolvase RuvX [Saccharospirillum mangrovi]
MSADGHWLGFDFGLAWIGVAAGQRLTQTASPLPPLRARDGIPNWDAIDALVNEWKPAGFVVGIPYNMDGSDSEMGARANKFRKRLHGRYGLPAEAIDERLSSREARSQLGERGKSLSKARQAQVDSIAAQLILETFLLQTTPQA